MLRSSNTAVREIPYRSRISHVLFVLILIFHAPTAYGRSDVDNALLGLSAVDIAAQYGNERTYTITRNGKRIGKHILTFVTEKRDVTVRVDSSLKVSILGIPVYRLSYVAQEYWQNNRLVSTFATTTENGNANTVKWEQSSGDQSDVAVRFASNHWHPGVLTDSKVFNTLTGGVSTVSVSSLGMETVDVNGTSIKARHYRYEDEVSADVWYDEQGLWLMMKFKGEDGSAIQYLRQD